MLRRFAPALIAAALASPALAQTTPNDPQSPPESVSTIPGAPTTAVAQSDVVPVIDVDRIVVLGFPTYDRDGVPGLSVTEFGQWVSVLFTNARQSAPTAGYISAAFAQSDVSKDGVVSTGELAAFLKGG